MRTQMVRRMALFTGLACGSLFLTLGLLMSLHQRASAAPPWVCCNNQYPGDPPGQYRIQGVCEPPSNLRIWAEGVCPPGGILHSSCVETCF
jgi:hypothetical protein